MCVCSGQSVFRIKLFARRLTDIKKAYFLKNSMTLKVLGKNREKNRDLRILSVCKLGVEIMYYGKLA